MIFLSFFFSSPGPSTGRIRDEAESEGEGGSGSEARGADQGEAARRIGGYRTHTHLPRLALRMRKR